jgi:hypothetical protein
MKSPKPISKPSDFLFALIRTAYLPHELPPAITTRHFANFCKTEYLNLKSQQPYLIKKTTRYDTFTAPRTDNGRRPLALVHPISQLAISLLITQHRTKIIDIINRSGTSLYRTDENPASGRAFQGLDFRKRDAVAEHLYSECPIVLRADISRFFYTIYTHSVPWAILGKEKVKNWLVHHKGKLKSHWSNDLDTALQSCQSRETFGIPVGPDTSRVIAEILLAGVEADKNLRSAINGRPAWRLLDDFIIGFDDEEAARKALAALRSALWKYQLQLNEGKTSIIQSHVPIREMWKLEFDATVLSDLDPSKQERDIHRLINLALHFCTTAGNGIPATWACQRLSRLSNISENFAIILDGLLRLARHFPSCTAHVAAFMINNQARCRESEAKARIARWIRGTLRAHLQPAHDFELAWCLVVAGVLRISIDDADLAPFNPKPNSVVFAILALLRERGLLSIPLSKWKWRGNFKLEKIYGENWLLYYEAVRRNWTADKNVVAAVKQDPILAKMLASKVTFLEDKIFDAKRISMVKRVFGKRPPQYGEEEVSLLKEVEGATKHKSNGSSAPEEFIVFEYD